MQPFERQWVKSLGLVCAITSGVAFTTGTARAQSSTATVSEDERTTSEHAALRYRSNAKSRIKTIRPAPQPVTVTPSQPGVNDLAQPITTDQSFLPPSLHDWMKQSTMTGDWGGWRPWLTDKGVNITGHYFQDSAGNPMGGKSQNVRYAHEIGLNFDFDLKKLTGYSIGLFHFIVTSRADRASVQNFLY